MQCPLRRGYLFFAFVMTGTLVYAGTGNADEDRFGESLDHDNALRARNKGVVRSLDSVISGIRQRGKVLDVELKGSKYKLKILERDGRVVTMIVDASTSGEMANSGKGDSRGGGSESSGMSGGSDHGSSGKGGSGSSGGGDRNENSGGRGRDSGR